jgi:ATP-binding cassette subfamily B protein
MKTSRIRRYLVPQVGTVCAAGAAMTLRAGVLLMLPWPLKFVIDSVVAGHALPGWLGRVTGIVHDRYILLAVLALATLLLGVIDAGLDYLGNRLFLIAGQRVIFAVRCDLFAHVQRLSLAFHRRRRVGELLARFGGDVQTLQDFLVALGAGLFVHLLTVVGITTVMLLTDWRFALVALSVVPVLLGVAQHYSGLVTRSVRIARRREGALWGTVAETLAGVHLVQAYGREAYEDERFAGEASESLSATLRASEMQVRFAPLISTFMAVATALTLWYGALRVLDGAITPGGLLVFLAYLAALAAPVRQLAKAAGITGKARVAIERLSDIFSERPDVHDAPDVHPWSHSHGALEFSGVSFAYGSGKPALTDVSFRVSPGETVAIVGPTGAGKSTLLGLVPRFHDPTAGAVLLDGRDLRTLPLSFVRGQVALVLQEALIFGGTVWENIAYGRADATRADAISAAIAVGVHDVISLLQNGYDTELGERGATLSGGQRQCIAIARAMLRDAPIVLLDEPTSGLDALNERRVVAAMRRLTESRTTLIIAHRLATVRAADRILVVDGGRIVEAGAHDTLTARHGAYAALWADDQQKEAVHIP